MSHANDDSKQARQTASVVNTFLLFATLGMLGFIGNSTWDNSKKLEAIAASQITRTELDTKLTELRTELIRLQARQTDVELQIARLIKP